MRYWYVNKFKNFYHTDNFFEFVQEKAKTNLSITKKFHYQKERKEFEILCKSMKINKEIITIHIRQPGFHLENSNSKIRNSDLNQILSLIDKIKQGDKFSITNN